MAAFGMGSASAYGNNPMGHLSRIQNATNFRPAVAAPPSWRQPVTPPGGFISRQDPAPAQYGMNRPAPAGAKLDPGFARPAPAPVDRAFGRAIPGMAAAGAQDPVGQLLAQLGIRTPAQRALFSRWITAANAGR